MATSTPYIVVGSRGTALPLGMKELPKPLILGLQKYRWKTNPPTELDAQLNAWVAAKGEMLEILDRNKAIADGKILAVPVTWQKNGQRFSGTAFLKSDWKPKHEQPQYVAVECEGWNFGVVEYKRLGDRNLEKLAVLNFGVQSQEPATSSRIRLVTESSGILAMILDNIRERKESIRSGHQVEVVLELAHDGYSGEHIVEIPDGKDDHFTVEAVIKDQSRFPARIRAAATALRELNLTGRFRIKHEKSSVWIQSLSPVQSTPDEVESDIEEKLLASAYSDPSASEGKRKLVAHLRIERNRAIVQKKKQQVLKATGKLVCECCGFDFSKYYGPVGHGFCEVHHRIPLSELDGETDTKLSDLSIVCANCHRMLHRAAQPMTVDEMKTHIEKRKQQE